MGSTFNKPERNTYKTPDLLLREKRCCLHASYKELERKFAITQDPLYLLLALELRRQQSKQYGGWDVGHLYWYRSHLSVLWRHRGKSMAGYQFRQSCKRVLHDMNRMQLNYCVHNMHHDAAHVAHKYDLAQRKKSNAAPVEFDDGQDDAVNALMDAHGLMTTAPLSYFDFHHPQDWMWRLWTHWTVQKGVPASSPMIWRCKSEPILGGGNPKNPDFLNALMCWDDNLHPPESALDDL